MFQKGHRECRLDRSFLKPAVMGSKVLKLRYCLSSKTPVGAPPREVPFLQASNDVSGTTGSLDLGVIGKGVNFSCLKLKVSFQFSLVHTLWSRGSKLCAVDLSL